MAQENSKLEELEEEGGDAVQDQFRMVARAAKEASPGEDMATVYSAFGVEFTLAIKKVRFERVFVTITISETEQPLVAEESDCSDHVGDTLAEMVALATRRYLTIGENMNQLLRGDAR